MNYKKDDKINLISNNLINFFFVITFVNKFNILFSLFLVICYNSKLILHRNRIVFFKLFDEIDEIFIIFI